MGMFTTIFNQDKTESYQIKCGYDDCEEYVVGDTVRQWINPKIPNAGKLLDDVYEGLRFDRETKQEKYAWIIIKNKVIVAIEPYDSERGWEDYQVLKDKYQIQDLPRENWSEEIWEKEKLKKNAS